MWLVVKYKKKELEIFKKALTEKLGEKPIFLFRKQNTKNIIKINYILSTKIY